MTIAASIPNPFFDLAGLTCGHFQIPFGIFFTSTFIGKAINKASMQTAFIVFTFSKHLVDRYLLALEKLAPWLGDIL